MDFSDQHLGTDGPGREGPHTPERRRGGMDCTGAPNGTGQRSSSHDRSRSGHSQYPFAPSRSSRRVSSGYGQGLWSDIGHSRRPIARHEGDIVSSKPLRSLQSGTRHNAVGSHHWKTVPSQACKERIPAAPGVGKWCLRHPTPAPSNANRDTFHRRHAKSAYLRHPGWKNGACGTRTRVES